jgi:hypothetical protein
MSYKRECFTNYCENGGTCTIDSNFNIKCLCTKDWSGTFCSEKLLSPSETLGLCVFFIFCFIVLVWIAWCCKKQTDRRRNMLTSSHSIVGEQTRVNPSISGHTYNTVSSTNQRIYNHSNFVIQPSHNSVVLNNSNVYQEYLYTNDGTVNQPPSYDEIIKDSQNRNSN